MDALKPYSYLLINLLSIMGPLALSFDNKVRYSSHWLKLLPGLFITAIVFIVWDIWFTELGVWSFNAQYLTGIKIYNLPIEECMFFFTIPFSCMFIYVIFRTNLGIDQHHKFSFPFIILAILFVLIAILSFPRYYTYITALMASFISIVHHLLFKRQWFLVFTITYIIHLIPFFVVNGILTATPIVLYNDAENCGIRLFTIPLEDSMYSYVLLLMNVTIFECIHRKTE